MRRHVWRCWTQSVGLAVLTATLVWQGGCGSARRSEPLRGAFAVASPQVERGRRVFMEYCQKCHPGGEAGLGPALNDKPFPGFLQRLQVRNGLGAMPAFSPAELSAAQLDDLLAYLRALRQRK